ncbi:MAG: prolipoprotein diacylglyceryl transferase [Firmicutes bacterium]|nr:prolipoprotein diacylglyceryl transferase [Bacillota bacterium]
MLDWLIWLKTLTIFDYLSRNIDILCFVTILPLLTLFLLSPRINARLEPAVSGPRWLERLSQSFSATSVPEARKKRVFWLLKKTDWLLCDKLKLIPDVRTGRRVNFFYLLLSALIVSNGFNWIILDSKAANSLRNFRNTEMDILPQMRPEMFLDFFLLLFYFMLLALPFFLIRKNREFYYDVIALFIFESACFIKLTNCWYQGCCFGIPCSWGVYNDILETTVFPLQLFEFSVGFLLSIACVSYMLYAKSYRPGYGCSFCLLSFMVPRFFWDYLRYYGEGHHQIEAQGIGGFTMVQVVCLVAVVLGIVWPFVLPLEKRLLDKF